ncbi:Molybdopterin molybdenumtransferase [Actinomadura rubteroloni]|uniref:Molybdopterin molybdenumtransferase n=1 Tax=Actinomadura rubteroloni TaxID=1926885 RepID=A0A2P4UQG3_9ACTN|nr:gephyrin-like molybdotransferase Glp [Actinomadura rubteroloni]POM27301.1 Molybdopterin molybdenumtransferase [Actinomadura rubteroloni]
MRTVAEHLAGILAEVSVLAPEEVALPDAAGTVLAEPVAAPVALPPFDNSAMDGYAVVAADIAGATEASPVALPVRGDIAAGVAGVAEIGVGSAARIMTGAPLPAGADAVVPVEWTDGGVRDVRVLRAAPPGNYIRRSGEDVVAGQVVADAGTRLGAAQIGMLAAVGRPRVSVRRKPRVVVLSTGSELREPGSELEPGQIWDSNSFMLAVAVDEAGGTGRRRAIVADDPADVLRTLRDLAGSVDAIVTTGGVSMGARDVVKEVLTGVGTMAFHKVRMRPGKPQGFGLLDGTPVFTLPGNPVSAYVSFQVFVRPALRAMQGLPPESLPTVSAVLGADVRSPAGIRHYQRSRLSENRGHPTVTPAEGQGSHQLGSLAGADSLIVLDEEAEAVPAGAHVEVMRLPS